MVKRVACFVDGFNLYHAVKRLNGSHLKWLNLWALMERQVSPISERLVAVNYFSAFANWMPAQKARHEEYVRALSSTGVTAIMGQFKEKDRYCRNCQHRWKGHEEKETDVNIALHLLNEAYKGTYDKALVVSRDSDLKPAVAMVLSRFPGLEIAIVAPPHLGHSNDLISVATTKRKITKSQIEACLFPQHVVDPKSGVRVAVRPVSYDPPA